MRRKRTKPTDSWELSQTEKEKNRLRIEGGEKKIKISLKSRGRKRQGVLKEIEKDEKPEKEWMSKNRSDVKCEH